MSDEQRRIAENVADVRQRIAAAAGRSSRTSADVLLVAVTKYVGVDIVRSLVAAGCHALGESRPQDLWTKAEALADPHVQWHLIGHLQRNKIRRTARHVTWLHSADSQRLLDALDQEASGWPQRLRVLLEVNISGDAEKTGFPIALARQLADQLGRWPHLEIGGLMAMSARESDVEGAREDFVRLRELRDAMQRNCPPGITLHHLSMGMSRDYEAAVEEGATMVRVGSALLEGVIT